MTIPRTIDALRERLLATVQHESEVQSSLDAIGRRLKEIRKAKPMKYALESLPELIGDHQFRDLCLAMGIETAVQLPSGPEFADIVAGRKKETDR